MEAIKTALGHDTTKPVHIRWMIRRDMPEVLEIEQECFEFPWSEDDFVTCLRQRNCIGMVAERGDRVIGYMLYDLYKRRLDLLSIVVAPQHQRQGIGSQMIAKLISKLRAQRRHCLTATVRETNLRAQLFFKSQGLRAVSIDRMPWDDTDEDGYVMRYSVME